LQRVDIFYKALDIHGFKCSISFLSRSLELKGEYQPGDIRRVWIPKAGGGERGLGIPDVIDRVVQEAVRQVLEPRYEPKFHENSHGFRPHRSCHTAIAQATEFLKDGFDLVVDIDLKDFFNRVHHQRLLATLQRELQDARVLKLIGRMLKAKVVMPEGVRVNNEQGVPQGGPLSPLLSNIVLDELDRELTRRGLRFVRYADDCNIYVRSRRAGERVMASITRFIEKRLRLEVNAAKSAVAKPKERHFLGFSLNRNEEGEVEINLSERSKVRLRERVKELSPRNWGDTMKSAIAGLNAYLKGWTGFFGICTGVVERFLNGTDAHIRRRLRALKLKQWKWRLTILRRLVKMGAKKQSAGKQRVCLK
jgi:group II intron reverse transcriptase/maturase